MGNIVRLSNFPNGAFRDREEVQLELFGQQDRSSNYVVFIDADGLDQDLLMDILTRNAITSILDIRARPVFRRPKFVHADIFRYLSYRRIHYFDYAIAMSDPVDGSPNAIARRVNHGRESGLTLCLYDQSSKDRGWIDVARRTLKRSKLFKAELSPAALA